MRSYRDVPRRLFGSFRVLRDAPKNTPSKDVGAGQNPSMLKMLEEEVYKDKELMKEEFEETGEKNEKISQALRPDDKQLKEKRRLGLFDGAGDRLRRGAKNRSSPDTNRPNKPYVQKAFTAFQTIDRAFLKTGEISSQALAYSGVKVEDHQNPPPLAHNLDRVLFNPGVHFLKDPRSGVYNFSPYLQTIMSVKDFDFNKIPQYVPSGKDHRLSSLAKDHGKKYVGSTSSLTGILSHLHRTLSHERKPHIMSLSKLFPGKTKGFTYTQLKPVSVFLRYNEQTGVHSVDSDQSNNEEIIVSVLGHLLEAMLTTPEVEFEKMRKGADSGDQAAAEDQPQNAYHYTECGDFLMRSQLDCIDSRLPGTGVFDLKTRAVCAVRHDMDYAQIHDGSHYMVNKLDGMYESFAREWYELIRSTMFKYSLQARIGRMDGIFLAYHNIKQMFGFQYVPLEEMDKIYHTSDLLLDSARSSDVAEDDLPEDLDTKMSICGPLVADAEFKLSVELMSQIFDKIIASHKKPGQSFNVVFYKSERRLYVFAKPMTEENINKIQAGQDELELIHSPGFKQTYQFGQDPHTIGQHAALDNHWLPPDVKCYELDLRTFINNKLIQPNEFPSLESEDDDWKIQYKLTDQSYIMAAKSYNYVFGNMKPETTRITSIPQLVRLEEEIEERIKEEALQKLEPPTKMQQLMRTLSDRGRRQQEQQQQHSKEKKLWFPKPVEFVNKEQHS